MKIASPSHESSSESSEFRAFDRDFIEGASYEDLVQKVPKLAKNHDFQVLAARNTDFWRSDEMPYIIDG